MTESQTAGRVLFVDDEESVRFFATRGLRRRGFEVSEADSGLAALRQLDQEVFDVMVTDLRMPGLDGFELCRRARALQPEMAIVVITAHGTVDNAVQALREGAQDFLAKPFEIDELAWAVERVRRGRSTVATEGTDAILGASSRIEVFRRSIAAAASGDASVLVVGESGTGKSLGVRCLHAGSERREEPFVAMQLAGLDPERLGPDLERASRRAGSGTLCLCGLAEIDESAAVVVRDLASAIDARLTGTAGGVALDVPEPLQGLFLTTLEVPPLRERREDVPVLAQHFLRAAATELGASCRELRTDALESLASQSWPGNVRELRNVVQRSVVLHRGIEQIGLEHLPEFERSAVDERQVGYHEALQAFDLDYFSGLFRATLGNVTEAARRAGLSRGHLHRKAKQLGLEPDRFR